MVVSLRKPFPVVQKIVPQVIEAEFIVGTISDVGAICFLFGGGPQKFIDDMERAKVVALFVLVGMLRVIKKRFIAVQHADGEPECRINLSHPDRIAAGEIVIDGYDMHAPALKSIEVGRQGRYQSLALAGLHLGDTTLVHSDAAQELNVKVTLSRRAFGCFAHQSVRFGQEVIECFLP